jgi:hypothetical protein
MTLSYLHNFPTLPLSCGEAFVTSTLRLHNLFLQCATTAKWANPIWTELTQRRRMMRMGCMAIWEDRHPSDQPLHWAHPKRTSDCLVRIVFSFPFFCSGSSSRCFLATLSAVWINNTFVWPVWLLSFPPLSRCCNPTSKLSQISKAPAVADTAEKDLYGIFTNFQLTSKNSSLTSKVLN